MYIFLFRSMAAFFEEYRSGTKWSHEFIFREKLRIISEKMSSQMVQSYKRVSAKDKIVQNCKWR